MFALWKNSGGKTRPLISHPQTPAAFLLPNSGARHKSAIKNAEQGWKQCKTEARNLQNAQKRRRFAGAVFESYGKRQRPGLCRIYALQRAGQGAGAHRENRPCRHGSANSKILQRTSLHRGLFSLPVRQRAQTKAKSLRACSTICARPYNYNNPCEEKGREGL